MDKSEVLVHAVYLYALLSVYNLTFDRESVFLFSLATDFICILPQTSARTSRRERGRGFVKRIRKISTRIFLLGVSIVIPRVSYNLLGSMITLIKITYISYHYPSCRSR